MKKFWKQLIPAVLAVMLLASCGEKNLPAEGSLPESTPSSEAETSEISEPESSVESSGEESSEPESSEPEEELLSSVRTLEMDYDSMIVANYDIYETPNVLPKGSQPYYAVEKDGKWGLIDENGTELLPCLADAAVGLCPEGHWTWWASCTSEEWDQFSAAVEEATEMPLCAGHGGGSCRLFATEPGEPARVYWGMEGAGGIEALEDAHTQGDAFFPTLYTSLIFEGEDMVDLEPGGFWNFSNREGEVLCPDEKFEQVGWFGGEALAPVQKDGKWAYVDGEGNFATEFVYDSCWGSGYFYSSDTGEYTQIAPCYVYSFWNGAAAVLRDGKWGILDETGNEAVSCAYEGGAPYPGGAWLKEDGSWNLYLLNE